MKLLFDQNLSPRLVLSLSDLYPGSAHVYGIEMDKVSDVELWEYARQHEYTIVTRDADFSELSDVKGFPPKVIWIRRGNCSTGEIELIFREHGDAISALDQNPTTGVLTLL